MASWPRLAPPKPITTWDLITACHISLANWKPLVWGSPPTLLHSDLANSCKWSQCNSYPRCTAPFQEGAPNGSPWASEMPQARWFGWDRFTISTSLRIYSLYNNHYISLYTISSFWIEIISGRGSPNNLSKIAFRRTLFIVHFWQVKETTLQGLDTVRMPI